ncbi:hypothetical protein [Gimesia fumaroli]|uniref:Carboxypeptidase regulatory-like domain-containing protein n=1 Tax=Gimesia fumaroli TaxID=2527976 RepID=A0A518IKN2_9PLAN|nr:hypothetical protein [Gimesia fumaroli]QDV53658.1 hypothetical protein Enr17x_57390 [Gimesia fumaroli]
MLIKKLFDRHYLFFVLLYSSSILTGCGGASEEAKQRADVTITVTHEGTPVTEAEVRMMQVGKGEGAVGMLNESGQAELSDVVLGSYLVTVNPPEGTPDNPAPKKEYPNIPKQYRSLKDSPLKADVQSGDNEFTFELK